MFSKNPAVFLLALLLLSALPAFAGASAASPAVPPLTAVDSTLIAGIGYDAESRTLAIAFRNSIDVFLYEGVPQDIYDQLLAAESRGRCFTHSVKPVFQGRTVPGGATNAVWRTPAGGSDPQ